MPNLGLSAHEDVASLNREEVVKFLKEPCSAGCILSAYFFIEPMKWMLRMDNSSALLNGEKGVISCPDCKVELGDWAWRSYNKCNFTCKVVHSPRLQIKKEAVTVTNPVREIK